MDPWQTIVDSHAGLVWQTIRQRKPRELCGVLRERVVHCTFLGENGGQYQ